MIRLTIFIIALLFVTGTVEPSGPWFVALAVLSGIELLSFRHLRLRLRLRRLYAWLDRPWTAEYDW